MNAMSTMNVKQEPSSLRAGCFVARCRGRFAGVLGLAVAGALALALPLPADDVVKANNTDNLNLATSWVGDPAAVPGADDVAVWDSTVTAANTSDLGANLSLAGIRILNPGGGIGISGAELSTGDVTADSATDSFTYSVGEVANGNVVVITQSDGSIPSGLVGSRQYFIVNADTVGMTYQVAETPGGAPINFTTDGSNLSHSARPVLTLGASGIDLSASTRNLASLSATLSLSADQIWNVATGRTLDSNNNANHGGFNVFNNGHTVTIQGGGSVDLGNLRGGGGIVMSGLGWLRLYGASYGYTGDVTINSGTVLANNQAGSLGSGASALTLAGGTLTCRSNFDLNYARNTTVSGDFAINNNNSNNTGAMDYTFGTLSIGTHTLTLTAQGSNEGNIIFGATTLTGNPVFDVGSREINQLQLGAVGQTGGSRGLTKTGVGTLILNGNNTYTGATDIQEGAVKLGAAGTLAGTSGIAIAAGATLDVSAVAGGLILNPGQTLSGSGAVVGGLTVGANAVLSPGSSPGILTVDNLTLADSGETLIEINGVTTAGVDYDRIVVNDTLTYQSGWVLRLSFGAEIAGTHTLQIFGLAGYSGEANLPTFAFAGVSSAESYSFNTLTGELTFTNATAIPEPHSLLLIALGGVLLRLRRRVAGPIGR